MSFSNYLSIIFEKVKAESATLKDDRTAWQKFWEDWGGLFWLLVFLVVIIAVLIVAHIADKRKNTQSARLITIPSKEEPILRSRVRVVALYGHSESSVEKGDVFVAPFIEREGYAFGGWFYDTACTIPYKTTKIRKSITLYPKWTKES